MGRTGCVHQSAKALQHGWGREWPIHGRVDAREGAGDAVGVDVDVIVLGAEEIDGLVDDGLWRALADSAW